MKYDLLTIGGATCDIIFFTDEGILIENKKDPLREKLLAFEYGAKIRVKEAYFTSGGGACNTAVCFSRLGLKVAPIIRIGNDKNSQIVLENLKKEKIDLKFVQIDKKLSTGFSFIAAIHKEKDHVAFLYRGANDNLQLPAFFPDTNWIYISSLGGNNWSNILRKSFNLKKTNPSLKIAWNPGSLQLQRGYKGLIKYLKNTDVLILNEDETTELILSFVQRMDFSLEKKSRIKKILYMAETIYQWGPNLVVITCGAKGAYVYDGKILHYSPSLKRKRLETTGAGDAFGSSFVAGLILYKNKIKKALKLAIFNSSSVISEIGAQKGLQRKREIKKEIG